MMTEQRTVQSFDGTQLECSLVRLHSHESSTLALLLPAHPLLGGSISQLQPLAHSLARSSSDVAMLAYRGTGGRSSGYLPPVTASETLAKDVSSACFALKHQFNKERVLVIGYSFGAAVVSRSLCLNSEYSLARVVHSVTLLATPYGSYSTVSLPLGPLCAALMRSFVDSILELEWQQQLSIPILLLFPSHDAITPPREVESLKATIRNSSSNEKSNNRHLAVDSMTDGEHFDAVAHDNEILRMMRKHSLL